MVLEAVNSLQRQPPADTVEDLPGPASTLEDLNDLVKKPHELVMVLKCMVGVNLKDTIRRMMKRTMTPTLAAQFSYSGLGMQRQHTKLTFKNHPAFHILIDALAQSGFEEDMKMKVSYVQDVLRHSSEWNGRNKKRAGARQSANTSRTRQQEIETGPSEATPSPSTPTGEGCSGDKSSSAGKSLALRPILPKPSARHRSHGASSSQRQSPNTSDSEFRQRLCEPPTKLHQVSLYTRQPTNSQSDSTTESSSDGSSSSSLTHVSGTDSD